jgi:hypothetical protein
MVTTAAKEDIANAMSNTKISWPVKGGGVIWPNDMTDGQLRQALAHGLRYAAKHFHAQGMDELTDAAGGDGGMEYLADVQSQASFDKSTDRTALYKHMATIPRYRAVMQEARGRVHARNAIEKAAARHTPR